jgi:hypothetical protein
MPLSRVTLGALQDLGYSVNYAKADPFTLPKLTVAAAGLSTSNGLSTRLVDFPLSPGMNLAGSSTTTVSGGTSAAGSTTTQQTVTQSPPATGTRQFVIARQGQAPVMSTAQTTRRPSQAARFGAYGS